MTVTVSIGVATVVPNDQSRPRDLIIQSDEALYRAKATGRNKVCVYGG
ncbi:MAG: GGDEF domain-containing protein [Pseudomonadales bacterium]